MTLISQPIMSENSIVFIDSHYLDLIAQHLLQTKKPKYDINQFAITLTKEQGLWCEGTRYYTAPPYQSANPTADEIRRRGKYDRFVNKLRSIPNFVVREGRCQKSGRTFTQKGVDQLLAADLPRIPLKRGIKKIVLVCCDTDLVPILKEIRRDDGIEVILYFYSDYVRGSKFSMSNHMLTACDKCVLIERSHFIKSMRLP